MKKIITVIAFFALTLGISNTVVAQSFDAKIANVEANEFVKEFKETLNLSAEQEVAMYNANMLKLRMTASAKNEDAKNEINATFTDKLKAIMNSKQYKKYLKLNK